MDPLRQALVDQRKGLRLLRRIGVKKVLTVSHPPQQYLHQPAAVDQRLKRSVYDGRHKAAAMPCHAGKIADLEIAIAQIRCLGWIAGHRQTDHLLAQKPGQPEMIVHRVRQPGALEKFSAQPEFPARERATAAMAKNRVDSVH